MALFTLNTITRLGLGVASLLRSGVEKPLPLAVQWVIVMLMFANAGAMLAAGASYCGRVKRVEILAPERWNSSAVQQDYHLILSSISGNVMSVP